MNSKEKFEKIKKNTFEIVEETELKTLLKSNKKPKAYMGYATSGMLHIGHLIPIVKLADLISSGIDFTFMAANIHAYLDDKKSPWTLLDARAKIYLEIMKAILSVLGIKESKIKMIKGSDFEFNKNYWLDILQMSNLVTLKRTKRATSEVIRFGNAPKMGGFFYPFMQIEDIVALKADITFSGVDQRGIYMLGRELLPQIGHQKPICIFTPLLGNLEGNKMEGKMSSSSGKKISLIDSNAEIKKKISNAFCPANEIKNNPVLDIFELIVFPILGYQKRKLIIKRPEKFGGNLKISNLNELQKLFSEGKIHPMDLKNSCSEELILIISEIRKNLLTKKPLLKKAYPNLI